ncbi:F-box domain [Macleaya cordata]|uniref:F-box domain n=1 Tax=Macleaya cordata TaxID=56857 RepID=A0A200QBL7_MACCD|nr:F-box domain [Macleaya cordata]
MDLEEDKISELPDALLHHILSFLPTKSAVRTSILSKRWKYLWTSIPVLDFRKWRSGSSYVRKDERRLLETKKFSNFVDRMLSLPDIAINIHKFYLNCDKRDFFDASQVTTWISTVVTRKVEELILFIDFQHSSLLPPCFFTCESLTMLELDMYVMLDLPNSISFPRLKILRLKLIAFMDDNLTQQFFSSCPMLEELVMTWCTWIDMNVVSISAPALKYLLINNPNGHRFDSISKCVLKIYAPNLLSLNYNDRVAKDYVLHSFSSLVDAEINFKLESPVEEPEEIGYGTSKLFGGLSNVKLLKMSGETFKALSFADNLLTNQPTFCNLIHLEVTSKFPCTIDRTLLDFLRFSPNLESLVFAQGFDQCLSNNDDSWKLNLVPQCLLLHLKQVEIREFCGHPGELNMVKLLLKNARVLKSDVYDMYNKFAQIVF